MRKLLLLLLLVFLVGCQPRNISVVLNPGYDIVGINTEWIDEGCTLNVNSSIAIDMKVSFNSIELSELGEYKVVYIEEYDNVEYSCTRFIKVVDETAPVVTLNPRVDTIIVGETWMYIDPGVLVDGEINHDAVVTTGTVDVDTVGTYVITYTVTDDSGNITVLQRVVNVIE